MADALDLASAILGSGVAITDANFTGKDAAVLEFDFVPTNSFLTFNYVFASEEYNEWVSTQFNDVFGFFVTDSLGVTTNIAVIPGTTTPIAINNVNSSTNPAYYLNNDTSDFGLSTTPYNTEFDGFTTGLTAAIQVIPDKKYHFKLAIADNSDGIYDSAVFITKGSFASLPLVPVTDSFLVSSYSSTPLDVLANDLVLEGKQPFIKAFDSSSINSGTVYLNDNQTPDNLLDDNLLYTPQSGFSGVDSFNYTLGDGSGNAVTGTVYIQVNMGGGVSTLSVGDVSVVENGSYEVWIPVTLTGIADQTFTVDYSLSPDTATENQDYTPVTGTLTFNPGDSIQYIVVPLQDDDSVEGNETFFVNLSNVSGGAVLGQTTGTVTITENEKYTFTYFYGNGDSYSGYGFAQLGTHGVGKLPYNYDNETGTQKGYYVIDSVEDSETGTDGYVYITSYTDADTGFGETTNIWYGGGYSGLGSEYGYAYNSDGSASDPYFTQYYEADIIRQKYTFTYFYGNGDNYSGYGFAPLGTYTEGQIIGNYINETSLYPARTGAVENNTLGYSRDSVYHLTYTFTNASDLLTLNFRGSNLEGIWNESWGLDNVKVTAGSFTHTNDFETDTVEGWSSSTRSTTPVGSRDFLGEFANDTVSLSLNHPDLANNPITLEFDLFIIGSWDGSFIPGPDYFTVETSEEQTLLNSTFGNNELQGQTYPDNLLGYYTIDSVENSETGTDGYVYITSYTDADTGFGTTTNVSGGLYAYGLGSEYGYAYNSDGNTFDPYFNSYYEADIIGQKYTFTYFYGNGDNYSGYGFAPLGTYTVGQLPDYYDNETGTQKGYYVINSVEDGATGTKDYVRVTSYTDADTGFGETTNIQYYLVDGGGYSGLGSEYGYANDGNGFDPYFTQYYEADIIGQQYTFTYFYGNGDNYSGYGFAPLGTYTVGQLPDYYDNETGTQKGYYVINSVEDGATGTKDYVQVTSYTDADTGFGETTSIYSGSGYYGLGSEYGYAFNANPWTGDTYFSRYNEADLPAALKVQVNLLADDGGKPGEVLADNRVGLNHSFFVQIQAGDFRPNAAGVVGLNLDFAWNGSILESINFNPSLDITSNFPYQQGGTLASDGLIDDLSGGSLPEFGTGKAIGVNQLETFALLHFSTQNYGNWWGNYFTTTVNDVALHICGMNQLNAGITSYFK